MPISLVWQEIQAPAVPAALIKRAAEGAIFVCPPLRAIDPLEGVPAIDVLCNGPGWTGGANCSGLFGDGDGLKFLLDDLNLVLMWGGMVL